MAEYKSEPAGFVTLGPKMVELMRRLDLRILSWAKNVGAEEFEYPPLMRVADLDRLDYFKSFPHLGFAVSNIREEACETISEGTSDGSVDAHCLCSAGSMLPSAACYSVYLGLKGSTLAETSYITTKARCFRNETYYDGLRRLLGFTMREIVCIGRQDEVRQFLQDHKKKILSLASELSLELKVEAASDPFFQNVGSKAIMQTLFPVKEEFVFGGDLAIASVNFHRNFFGDRCEIMIDGEPAYTGCVAFGMERWLHALAATHGNLDDVLAARELT